LFTKVRQFALPAGTYMDARCGFEVQNGIEARFLVCTTLKCLFGALMSVLFPWRFLGQKLVVARLELPESMVIPRRGWRWMSVALRRSRWWKCIVGFAGSASSNTVGLRHRTRRGFRYSTMSSTTTGQSTYMASKCLKVLMNVCDQQSHHSHTHRLLFLLETMEKVSSS
jgi:hypothetical protein